MLKLLVEDRNYNKYTLYDANTLEELIMSSITANDILGAKLFNNDVVKVSTNNEDNNHKFTIIHSCIRSMTSIPCVLICNDGKTFGKSSSGKKFLYKCIPDDKRLPCFVVPYELKQGVFSKNIINKYVNISFDHWNGKHPNGLLTQVIGDVNEIDKFYEYQLYCKSLNASIQQFSKSSINAIGGRCTKDIIEGMLNTFTIEDRRSFDVITIDSKSTTDFDDALSYTYTDTSQTLSIYITNVALYMQYLGLWESFSERISTIYLPDRKRPMIPTVLSKSLLSLIQGQDRIALCLDISYDIDKKIFQTSLRNVVINVRTNFVYNEHSLTKDKLYQPLFKFHKVLIQQYPYKECVNTSNHLIAYYMVVMNYVCAQMLSDSNRGIFRSYVRDSTKEDSDVSEIKDPSIKTFIQIWKSTSGQYVVGNCDLPKHHDLLGLDTYVHITSPIRRLVDLLNIIELQQSTSLLEKSESSLAFQDKWIARIDDINKTMRAIRKVQTESGLLHLLSTNPGIDQCEYYGYLFDKAIRNDKLYQYHVYIPKLHLVSRITSRLEKSSNEEVKVKIFTFEDEDNFVRKVRVQLLE